MFRAVFFVCLAAVLLSACEKKSTDVNTKASKPAPDTNQQVFQVKGVVVELEADGKTVKVKHEEIPNYMQAMTMLFEVKNTNELSGLAAGDSIAFRMTVTETDGWIDQIKKLDIPATNTPPMTGAFRLVKEVEPLNEGDPLPEYHFINQFGERITTSQFKGGALAITFLFTRCPFPTYCPLMSRNFTEVQSKLLTMANGPTNWHLLTISFDPEFDKPEILKAYAGMHDYNPKYWTFATGELIDITAIGEQLGLTFWTEGNNISHNLRTVVFDASGRLMTNHVGNQWTPDELAEEMVKASAVK